MTRSNRNRNGNRSSNKSRRARALHTRIQELPVGHHLYQALADLNRSFEQVIEHIERLLASRCFGRNSLRIHQITIEETRALANEELTEIINRRELQNSAHFERLRLQLHKKADESAPAERRGVRKRVIAQIANQTYDAQKQE